MSSEYLKRQVNRSKDNTSSHSFIKPLDKGEGEHENPKRTVFEPSPLIFNTALLNTPHETNWIVYF